MGIEMKGALQGIEKMPSLPSLKLLKIFLDMVQRSGCTNFQTYTFYRLVRG